MLIVCRRSNRKCVIIGWHFIHIAYVRCQQLGRYRLKVSGKAIYADRIEDLIQGINPFRHSFVINFTGKNVSAFQHI